MEWAENGAKSLSHGADDGNWEIAKGVTSVIIATHQGAGGMAMWRRHPCLPAPRLRTPEVIPANLENREIEMSRT
ncbi:MAG: hypothetical protein WDO73_01025 [Ignavibacteriota bacterium]